MAKLLVTADIHGSLDAWRRIRNILKPGDTLAVAGDLFDTRYGDRSSPDYNPGQIRDEFLGLGREAIETHIVYGNCDDPGYLDDFLPRTRFDFQGYAFFMNHGHIYLPDLTDIHVIIEGHSHTPRLDTLFDMVFLNPGSPSRPRNSAPGYALVENGVIQLLELPKHRVLDRLALDQGSAG